MEVKHIMDLALLVKLQNVDKKIMELESSIGDLPKQVEDLKTMLDALENEKSHDNEQLAQCNQTKVKLEGNIELLNDKLKKYQEQVYSVTTNKEYDAISAEIEVKENEIEKDETNVLELLEAEENLIKKIKQIEEQLEQIKSELEEKEEILSIKRKENEQELNYLLEVRESFISQIKKPIYSNYERIRKVRKGMAVAEVRNYTCDGCFATIPAQTVVEIRKMNNIIHCETCGRILVITNNVNNHETVS